MTRLYIIRWAFIFPCITKFQEKKILSGCFKFDDLNLAQAEAMEILKATAQSFGKSEIAAFSNNENSLYYFKMSLIDWTWVELLVPYKDYFGLQCHLPSTFLPSTRCHFHVKILNDVSSCLCSNILIFFFIWWTVKVLC